MNTLNETPVPFSSEIKRPEAARSVLRLFADHGWAARVWFVIAVVAVAAAFIQPFFIISAFRTQERVVVLDESGTYHISPLLDFEDATKLQTSQALLACLALLEKNPTGFDYPELLEKMYLPDALNQAKAMQSQEADELEAKQIHQKVEVQRVDVLQTRNNQVLVAVEGQLIRVGLFNGEPFTEAKKFHAQFTLLRNPNLTSNGRFPLAVWKFNLQ
jgi:flagellar biosynthesis regulator FlaF